MATSSGGGDKIIPPAATFYDDAYSSLPKPSPPKEMAEQLNGSGTANGDMKSKPATGAVAAPTADSTAPASVPGATAPAPAAVLQRRNSRTLPSADGGTVMRPDGTTATVTNSAALTAAAMRRVPKLVVPWQPDSYSTVCTLCKTAFGIFTRIHHCRLCGGLVCGACSTYRIVIPLGTGPNGAGEQRACKPCRLSITDYVKKLNSLLTSAASASSANSATNSGANSRTNSTPSTPVLGRVPIPPTPLAGAATGANTLTTPLSNTAAAANGASRPAWNSHPPANGKPPLSPAPITGAGATSVGASGAIRPVASSSSIASLTALPPVVNVLNGSNKPNTGATNAPNVSTDSVASPTAAAAASARPSTEPVHPTVVTTGLEKDNEKPIVVRAGSVASFVASPPTSNLSTPLSSPTPNAAAQAMIAAAVAGLSTAPTPSHSGDAKAAGTPTVPGYVISPRPASVSGLLFEASTGGSALPPTALMWLRTIELVSQYSGARATLKYWLWRGYPVPPIVRPLLWLTLTDALNLKRRAGSGKGSYSALCSRPPSVEAIWRDVPRSSPNETFLKYFGVPCEVSKERFESYLVDRPQQRALYRILTAYSNYEQRKVDYCQGMNYIASLLLLVLHDEEHAFWCLVAVLASARHGISDLFLSDQPHLKLCLSTFDANFKSRLPALHAYLGQCTVLTDSYAVEWFTTAFIYSTSYRTTVRIWDLFLLDGFEVLETAAISILECVQPTLMAHSDQETVLPLLRKCVPQLTSRMIFERVIEQSKPLKSSAATK